MDLLQKLLLPARRCACSPVHRFPLCPNLYRHRAKALPLARFAHITTNNDDSSPSPKPQALTPSHMLHPLQEAREHTVLLGVPVPNPSGGGEGVGLEIEGSSTSRIIFSPLSNAALSMLFGLGMVFISGIAYMKWYKKNVLDKIEEAFSAGYDPALELAKQHTKRAPIDESEGEAYEVEEAGPSTVDLRRKEQDFIDSIVHGRESGHYFMLLGPKDSGKDPMIFESMAECQADGVSVCDACPDLEVFRLRLGRALNYEFNEDTATGLFQRRGPREGGVGLDIERALNKLEKVALRLSQQRGRPLVLIISNIHHFKDDDGGRSILLQLQQRAEAWAMSGILTMVFSSDDFWPYHLMRRNSSRMHTLSIYDFNKSEAKHVITRLRMLVSRRPPEPWVLEEVVNIVGGRLSYLNKVSRSRDMVSAAKHLLDIEKEWLLNRIGLIYSCDNDVMNEQKWSSCSWLLLREFVKIRKEQEEERAKAIQDGNLNPDDLPELSMPKISYGKCRQIMTRADFIERLDRLNVISIDVYHDVRPESMLILHAARQICEDEDFGKLLGCARGRIDEIESLHRTRELTFKDLDNGDKTDPVTNKRVTLPRVPSQKPHCFDNNRT